MKPPNAVFNNKEKIEKQLSDERGRLQLLEEQYNEMLDIANPIRPEYTQLDRLLEDIIASKQQIREYEDTLATRYSGREFRR